MKESVNLQPRNVWKKKSKNSSIIQKRTGYEICNKDFKYLKDATNTGTDRMPTFYCSPRVHKKKIPIPERPIIATKG